MGKLKRSTILKNKSKKKTKVTIEELIQLAEECIDRCELETAYQYAKQALDLDPKSIAALESMASIQMEMGNSESAKNIYQKLIDLNPNEGFSKYMCMAQLSVELEAVNFYKKGIELMIAEYEKNEHNQSNKPGTSKNLEVDDEEAFGEVSKSDISTAYGSIAEIYLTDLCMEADAENLCKFYLDKSIEYDPTNPETLQLLASYWLSKDNREAGKKYILESLENWLPKYVEASESGLFVDPAEAVSLTYDCRINTSRILTEVEEFDKALTVLEQLAEEDDEVVYIWYMLGWVSYCIGEEHHSNAKYYLKRANELVSKIKYDQKYLDQHLKDHINELLEKLSNVASDDEYGDIEEKENMNDNDEEYETDSDDDEDTEKLEKSSSLKKIDDLKATSSKKGLTDSNNNNIVEEAMET